MGAKHTNKNQNPKYIEVRGAYPLNKYKKDYSLMDLFKSNQLCILHLQIFINFLCLLELIDFYFSTLKHKPITLEVKTLI